MVKKGDIVLVSLDPAQGSEQAKTRPAVVIQHDALNKYSNTTIIVPLTSTLYGKNYPMHVQITLDKKQGTVKTEQIRAIDKSRIKKTLGAVSQTTMRKIERALLHACDIEQV